MRTFWAAMALTAVLVAANWLLREAVSAPPAELAPRAAPSSADAKRQPPAAPEPAPVPASVAYPELAKIRAALAREDDLGALRELYALHHAVQDAVPDSLIREWIRRSVERYDRRLRAAGDSEERLALFDFLVFQEPGRATYFYRRAQVQAELGLHRDALASLDMVIHDPVLGQRGRALAQSMQAYLEPPEPPQPPQPSRTSARPAPPESPGQTVALRRLGDHFIVGALLNGQHALNLMIDTGASHSALSEDAARRIGLDLSGAPRRSFSTAGGEIIAPITDGHRLSVDGATVDSVSIGVLPLPDSDAVDGLLGMDYLRRFRFFLDQERAELRLQTR